MKKFHWKNHHQNLRIFLGGLIAFFLIGLIFYQSYALYKNHHNFNIMQGNIPNQNYDALFSYYLVKEPGEKIFQETIPEGYDWEVFIECNLGATGAWDYENWQPIIQNLKHSRTKCQINFKTPQAENFLKKIQSLPLVEEKDGLYQVSHNNSSITYTTDESIQQNFRQTELRYGGEDPNNYVWLNEELWRVIGLVNTEEGQKIKLIRDKSIGSYSWDSSEYDINEGYGIGEWSQAKLMKLLNSGYEAENIGGSLYWNEQSGKCYHSKDNNFKPCNFINIGLKAQTQNLIAKTTWNTGSVIGIEEENWTAANLYDGERSNHLRICNKNEQCNDEIERNTTYQGYVGLIYPSDYVYATSGDSAIERQACLEKSSAKWEKEHDFCQKKNWLYKKADTWQWTLTTDARQNYAMSVVIITETGKMDSYFASNNIAVYPTLYLKENTNVLKGKGTKIEPYYLT